MTESLSLTLQAFPAVNKEKESLENQIKRINQQKGSFRKVTEESLEDEIQALGSDDADKVQNGLLETVESVEDLQTKKEAVTTTREDIVKQVTQAYAESTHALDFVSQLLSKYAPASAQATISPFLKQNLPLGSLGGEVVQAPQVTDMEKHNQELVSIGWRMQSLNTAADSLLRSASRLDEEVGKETTYWNQVLAVKEQGWPISRLPREKHTLGVRYGFAEAYSDFRDRGLAALRREDDGSLSLDRGIKSRVDRTLRVRLLHQGKQIASTLKDTGSTSEIDSIETEILNSRNSIFDEELHHEIHREVRTLISQGVRCVGSSVLIPFENNKQIEIDLVSSEDTALNEDAESTPLVEVAATALRILLAYAHRQNLRNRSQKPPPLRDAKVARPLYPILKPVVEYLEHHSHIQSMQTFLQDLATTIGKAGLSFAVKTTASSHNLASISAAAAKSTSFSTIEALVQQLTSPLHSSIAINLLGESTVININVDTTLSPPNLGTNYAVVNKFFPHTSSIPQLPQSTQFSTLAALETHITSLTTFLIMQHLLSNFSNWRTFSPHVSSITRSRPGTRDREIVSFALTKGQLSMTWQRDGSLRDEGTWTWDAQGLEDDGGTRSLVDVFRLLDRGVLGQ